MGGDAPVRPRANPVLEPYNAHVPFPALTPGQRLFLDVNGYCVVPEVFSMPEVERMRMAALALRDKFAAQATPQNVTIGGCKCDAITPHYFSAGALLEADPAFFRYLTHPRMVGMAEELVGGKVKLDESALLINSRRPRAAVDGSCVGSGPGPQGWVEDAEEANGPPVWTFHRGGQPGFDSYQHSELYHCTFVKTLTNLTALDSPADGGTTVMGSHLVTSCPVACSALVRSPPHPKVIAGSHKLGCSEKALVNAALEYPELIHHVVAPAGSTMLMCETLVVSPQRLFYACLGVTRNHGLSPAQMVPLQPQHATGQLSTDRERLVIIGGYSHPKQQTLLGEHPSAQFLAQCAPSLRELLTGRPLWTWPERHRSLETPRAEEGKAPPYMARMWSTKTDARGRPVPRL